MPQHAVTADFETPKQTLFYRRCMVGPWLDKPYTFRALRKTFGPLWLRCDVCRRYVPLKIGGLQNVDYRTKTFHQRSSMNEAASFALPSERSVAANGSQSQRSQLSS